MNVWTFSGNIGRDSELRYTTNDKAVCQFPVACNSGWGDKKTTTWVRCSLWGKRAESLDPHLKKGLKVVVSGEATLHTYEKKDGTQGHSMELNVNEIEFMGDRQDKTEQPKQGGFRDKPAEVKDDFADDDIPF
jgi:single-strand DNA-binding protein